MKKIQKKFPEIKLSGTNSIRGVANGRFMSIQLNERFMKKLDEFKANYMRSAEATLKKVNNNISAKHIVEDVERVNNILNVLKRDAEEDVVVTGQEVVPTEIDEKIKENQANSGIGDKYEEQRKKDLDEKIKRLQAPYCAVFTK